VPPKTQTEAKQQKTKPKKGAKAEGWAPRKRGRPRVKNGQNGDQEGRSEAVETQ
jgi:hypothetical protein